MRPVNLGKRIRRQNAAILCAMILILSNACDVAPGPRGPTVRGHPEITIELVKIEELGEYRSAKVRVSNVSGRDILNAEVTCVALDANGREMDFMQRHVIYSEDGLAAGRTAYSEFIFDNPLEGLATLRFDINHVEYR